MIRKTALSTLRGSGAELLAFRLRAVNSNSAKFFRPLKEATFAAGLIVRISFGVAHVINRIAGHFASAKFLAFFGLAALCLHGQAERDQPARRFRQSRRVGLVFCPLYDRRSQYRRRSEFRSSDRGQGRTPALFGFYSRHSQHGLPKKGNGDFRIINQPHRRTPQAHRSA